MISTTYQIAEYITAISRRHEGAQVGNRILPLSKLPSVRTWHKGLQQTKHAPRNRIPSWCLEIVLSALQKPPYYPLDKSHQNWRRFLTRRAVFLTAVISAHRASELHPLTHPPEFSGSHVQVWTHSDFRMKVDCGWHRTVPIVLAAMSKVRDRVLRNLCVREALRFTTPHSCCVQPQALISLFSATTCR